MRGLTTIFPIGWGCVLPVAAATRSRRARGWKAFPFGTLQEIDLGYPTVSDLSYPNVTVAVRRTYMG